MVSICWVAATVLIIELATLAHRHSRDGPGLARVSEGLFRLALEAETRALGPCLPRRADRCQTRESRRRIPDSVVLRKSMDERVFTEQRGRIYLRELGEASALLVLLFFFAWLCGKGWLGGESAPGGTPCA